MPDPLNLTGMLLIVAAGVAVAALGRPGRLASAVRQPDHLPAIHRVRPAGNRTLLPAGSSPSPDTRHLAFRAEPPAGRPAVDTTGPQPPVPPEPSDRHLDDDPAPDPERGLEPAPPATPPALDFGGVAHPSLADRLAAAVASLVGGLPGQTRSQAQPNGDGGSMELAAHGVDAEPRPRGRRRITRILAGDAAAFDDVVAELGGDSPATAAHRRRQLEQLFEAILEGALSAGVLDPPLDHPFWGAFTKEQGRLILHALASLGFHFDGLGGWQDDRVPTKRDLSLALGYAGLDPVRIRNWPAPEQMAGLVRDVQIAGDEHLARIDPDMTAEKLEPELRTHGVAIVELMADWDRVRAALLVET